MNYKYNTNAIKEMYKNELKEHGYYPESFRNAMGDEFFLFLLEDKPEILNHPHLNINKCFEDGDSYSRTL